MKVSKIFLGSVFCVLVSGCTTQQLDTNIQTAAVISCLLADGSSIEYSVASAVVSAEGNSAGKNSQNVQKISGVVAVGSQTLCTSLSNLNDKIQSQTQGQSQVK